MTCTAESARTHFRTGLADQVTAREARLPVLAEQDRMLKMRGRQLSAEIELIVALGGGFYTDRDALGSPQPSSVRPATRTTAAPQPAVAAGSPASETRMKPAVVTSAPQPEPQRKEPAAASQVLSFHPVE